MRVLLQRVSEASVSVDGSVIGRIGGGLLAFVGVTHGDTEKDVEYLAEKTAHLRIFEDDAGKMNLDVTARGSAVLVISQFTLYADCSRGRRPGFSEAGDPAEAEKLYLLYAESLRKYGVSTVEKGRFGADMKVRLENDGPATFLLESK